MIWLTARADLARAGAAIWPPTLIIRRTLPRRSALAASNLLIGGQVSSFYSNLSANAADSATDAQGPSNPAELDKQNQQMQNSLSAQSVTENSHFPPMLDWCNTSSMANDQLEQHREIREYYRKIAWELPQLHVFCKPFERPSKETVAFKFSTYLGEDHPAASKVVMTVETEKLPLDNAARHCLRVIAGQRYNRETDTLKIACNKYPNPLQNKQNIYDTLAKLLAKAKEKEFVNAPLDHRFVKQRKKHKYPFPQEWIDAAMPQDANSANETSKSNGS